MAKKTQKQTAIPKKEVAENLLGSILNGLQKGFQTDIVLETQTGAEVTVGDVVFRLRRAIGRNHEFSKAIRDKLNPYIAKRGELAEGEDDPKGQEILAQIYCETIVTGMKTKDGHEVEYDDEAKRGLAQVLLSSPDLFTNLQIASQDIENYRKHRTEQEAKN